MKQIPTPLTEDLVGRPRKTLKGSYEYMVMHARRLERDRTELIEALADLLRAGSILEKDEHIARDLLERMKP